MTLPCVERLFPPSFTDSLTLAKAVDLFPVGLRMSVMREKGAILLVCGPFNLAHTSSSCSSVAGHSPQGLLSCPCPSIFIRPLAWVCRDGGHHYLTLSFMQIEVQILTYKFTSWVTLSD